MKIFDFIQTDSDDLDYSTSIMDVPHHDSRAKLSNERIIAAIAINDNNASCLERASISRNLQEAIKKHFPAGHDLVDDKNISK